MQWVFLGYMLKHFNSEKGDRGSVCPKDKSRSENKLLFYNLW